MPQHHRYFPRSHGYYYFRPYNYHSIQFHRDAVTRYGGDPRNPYSNRVFKDIYAEFDLVDGEDVPALPTPAPSPFVDDSASLSKEAPTIKLLRAPEPPVLQFSSRVQIGDQDE